MINVLKQIYTKTMELAGSRHALWLLVFVSFAESSFFPIPPDALLIPMILAKPGKALLYASLCTMSSVIGGMLGYGIGAYLQDSFYSNMIPIIDINEHTDEFVDLYNHYGGWAVFVGGLTPIPYKAITILSGMTGLSIPLFVIMSLLARGLRFFIIAVVLLNYGDSARDFIERRLGLVTLAVLTTIIAIVLLRELN